MPHSDIFTKSIYTKEQRASIDAITKAYTSISGSNTDLLVAQQHLKEKEPGLFFRGREIPQEITIPEEKIPSLSQVLKEEKEEKDFIQDLIDRIRTCFPEATHTVTAREKEVTSLTKNINNKSKSWFNDVYGIRIVPKKASDISSTLQYLEACLTNYTYYTLNTFAYTDELIKLRLPGTSIYYKAFHFYIPIKSFFLEIQVRTPTINIWSQLHHELVYKPIFSPSRQTTDYLDILGEMSNVTDYLNITESEYNK